MEKDPKIFLRHILDSIECIQKYSVNTDKQKFLESIQMQDAIIRRILVIGEAAMNLPDEFKEKHFEIPWHKMIGMRNELVHGYFGIDLKLVWDTAQDDLPPLKEQITKIL